jgi:carotenoid cleavage dioxygenase-like enzyme
MIRESTALDLQTRGRVPDELEGRLLRIGPNPIGAVAAVHTSLCSPGVRFTKGVCTSS